MPKTHFNAVVSALSDSTVVSGVAGYRILVRSLTLKMGTNGSMHLRDETGPLLTINGVSGAFRNIVLPDNPRGWCSPPAGEDLRVRSSGSIAFSMTIDYELQKA